jgi:hypothetical protein
MAILSSSLYPAVRAAIDIGLDSTTLPDATIALPIYAGAADLDVLARDPDAESRTGGELTHVQNAAVYSCAARLIVALPQVTQEESPEGYRYQVKAWDAPQRAGELRALASSELDAVLTPSVTDQTADRPTFFALASGRRGR